ncbi:MAG: GNAT family N-acetyltransferase, partial [Phycisphaerales bacterium]|nr:GNAT family N-acetyltransferase [Phycisphaerales bacterium]
LSLEQAEASLADERCYLLVAKVGDEPEGLLSAFRFPDVECGGARVYPYNIEVRPSSRRQGIGATLVSHLIALCDDDDVDLIWAGTDVANTAARRTFEATGGALEGESYAEYEWDRE